MRTHRNEEIRKLAKERNVKLWEIAEKLGCADATLSRKLRKELSAVEKKQIVEIIDCIALENQGVE